MLGNLRFTVGIREPQNGVLLNMFPKRLISQETQRNSQSLE